MIIVGRETPSKSLSQGGMEEEHVGVQKGESKTSLNKSQSQFSFEILTRIKVARTAFLTANGAGFTDLG